MATTKDDILEAISSMTVLELKELLDAFEEKFDVSAAAPVAVAAVGGAEPPKRLQMAVAYGSAAAALPGSALPSPSQIDLEAVRVYAVTPSASPFVRP